MRAIRALLSAVSALAFAAATGCGGPAPESAARTPSTTGTTTASPATVKACLPPVEGFATTRDADGKPLPTPKAAHIKLPDPRSLTGPATAEVGDEHVHPVRTGRSELPVTVDSCDGERVQVTDTSRILAVDLYGTLAEIVFSLGLGDNVVGRDTSTGFPEAAHLPLVTPSAHDLNAEAILELAPTVVLTDSSIGPPEVLQQLRKSGIPVIYFDDARTMEGIPSQIRAVAAALGVPDAGERLIERTQNQIVDALTLAPKGQKPLRMTFLYVRGSAGVYLMAGPGSGADDMIEAVGGIDTGTDIGLTKSFTPMSGEALIRARPELIIMMTKGLASIRGVDGLVQLPGIAQTPAGQHRRVVDIEDTVLLSFGPRTGQTIKALAQAIYRPPAQ